MSQQWLSNCNSCLWFKLAFIALISLSQTAAQSTNHIDVDQNLKQLLSRCQQQSSGFDDCMKHVFNELRAYFPTGIPDYNIKPFDPHHASYVEVRRGDSKGLGGFKLTLRNVSEYGWAHSEVTKYHTDVENHCIVYEQYFPEKSLEGYYEFAGRMLGTEMQRHGYWNLTLLDYSQTTTVRRIGEPGSLLKVNVEVDRIGGMQLHIGDLLKGESLNQLADGVINSMWQLGLPFLKPIINELVSRAFTDIFNESFRYFPLENFISNT